MAAWRPWCTPHMNPRRLRSGSSPTGTSTASPISARGGHRARHASRRRPGTRSLPRRPGRPRRLARATLTAWRRPRRRRRRPPVRASAAGATGGRARRRCGGRAPPGRPQHQRAAPAGAPALPAHADDDGRRMGDGRTSHGEGPQSFDGWHAALTEGDRRGLHAALSSWRPPSPSSTSGWTPAGGTGSSTTQRTVRPCAPTCTAQRTRPSRRRQRCAPVSSMSTCPRRTARRTPSGRNATSWVHGWPPARISTCRRPTHGAGTEFRRLDAQIRAEADHVLPGASTARGDGAPRRRRSGRRRRRRGARVAAGAAGPGGRRARPGTSRSRGRCAASRR